MTGELDAAVLAARAAVLHDLVATGVDTAEVVDLLDDAVTGRRAWIEAWPPGAPFVTGLVAQDVADALLSSHGRWPLCGVHGSEPLSVEPELGADPQWVCLAGCGPVAPVGSLARR